ncbi:MAG: branched-chain amino acid ABC transporter permease [Thermodesulfobacteriota bacterium]|nr:branched-chain amino acid ABC transporter permease [Thermodesulfobacteriota bacterium]
MKSEGLKRSVKEEKESKYWILPLLLTVGFLPAFVDEYYLSIFNLCGVYVVSAVGLDILTGICGQISLGHGAFIALGAYTYGFLVNLSVTFWVALLAGGAVAAIAGFIVGLPALRIKGLYLAIITLGCVFIVKDLIFYFGKYTGGHNGMVIPTATLGSLIFDSSLKKYYLIWILSVIGIVVARLLKHSKLGRAFSYIRFSEVAAEVSGVSLPRYKTLAFSVGCFYAGIGGGLLGINNGFIGVENFSMHTSFLFLIMLIIGGVGSIYGAVIGAIVMTFLLPEVIDWMTEYITFVKPEDFETLLFGLITLVFIILEPNGIYGRWTIVRNYFKAFPLNEVQVKRVRWIRRWL